MFEFIIIIFSFLANDVRAGLMFSILLLVVQNLQYNIQKDQPMDPYTFVIIGLKKWKKKIEERRRRGKKQ